MIIRYFLAMSSVMLVGRATQARAGSKWTTDVRNAAKERRNTLAEAGKSGGESTTATMHRQPTPKSVTQAEERLGEISDKDAEAYLQAMERAVAANKAGNLAECENALLKRGAY